MRVSVVARKINAADKDTLKLLEARFDPKNNIGIFPGAGDLQGKVLRESRAGHFKSRGVDIRCTKVSEQTCSRTGERTHECVSEFFSLAHACLVTRCDQGSGERRCQET